MMVRSDKEIFGITIPTASLPIVEVVPARLADEWEGVWREVMENPAENVRISQELWDYVKDLAEASPLPIASDITHPPHYTAHPSGVECITITEHMTFNLGNVVKYLWRNGLKDKNSQMKDLEKARWYLDREIFRLNALQAEPSQPQPLPK